MPQQAALWLQAAEGALGDSKQPGWHLQAAQAKTEPHWVVALCPGGPHMERRPASSVCTESMTSV